MTHPDIEVFRAGRAQGMDCFWQGGGGPSYCGTLSVLFRDRAG